MKTFKQLGISEVLQNSLNKQGIQNPTPIQRESIPHIKSGRDVLGVAQTGTGKTLSFLLPMFDKFEMNGQLQGIVLSPTRELALQITEVAKTLQKDKPLKILAVYGGQDIELQLKKLKNEVNLIIATPGRLLDHMKRHTVNLGKVNTLVLDEADTMLKAGFLEDIEHIVRRLPNQRQTLCFSATMNAHVRRLVKRTMTHPLEVEVEKNVKIVETVDQNIIKTTEGQKFNELLRFLERENPFMGIIFCNTKRRAHELYDKLSDRGINCAELHGDISQNKREKIMKAFRNLEIHFLIATDIAARGIDVEGVTHVINYDVPQDTEWFVHRTGRTGRAGKTGESYTFVTKDEEGRLNKIEDRLKIKVDKPKKKKAPVRRKDEDEKKPYMPKKKKIRSLNKKKKKKK